jgi:beta-lactam-binding protein with PASTA domain/predicted Ser/Thr protein kinase
VDQQTLGDRYRVEARIGQGGMAEVFRGFDPSLDRTVAIKVLVHPYDRDAGFVARFRREAQAAARLNHPNIVGVYDAGSDGDTQYIVMEHVQGRTLASFLARGGAPTQEQAVELTEKVAAALQAAHAEGIVHRDIKPANIMVTPIGEVKVMDFGIARLQTDATAPQTSSVIGTPAYFSPEQAQGHPVDPRSDIYSLGCVLYELLAHRQAFTGDTPVAIAYKQVNEVPPAPSAFNADVPPALDAVVMKCIAKNPANRYQDAGELIADLERARQGLDVEATPLMPMAAGGAATQVIARQPTQVLPPPEEDGSSRKIWLGVLIGLLVIALLAGGGYLLAKTFGNNQVATKAMPSVKGDQYEDAKTNLEQNYGLVVKRKESVSPTIPREQVIAQSVAPGEAVAPGTVVTLTVAVPPPPVPVPSLLCKTLQEALADLPDGLSLGTKTTATTADPDCPASTIISQDPQAGASVTPNSEKSFINVVLNPGSVTVGDYICETYPHASHDIEQLGLHAVEGEPVAPAPECGTTNPNFVAMQEPPAGSSVSVGDTVTLHMGSGTASPSATESPSATP